MDKEIELILMKILPNKFVFKYIKSTRDIFLNKQIINNIKYESKSFNYLLDLIIYDVKNQKRFRKKDCLNVVKNIMKNNNIIHNVNLLPEELLEKLFYLFKIFVLDSRYSDCVNLYIKDKILKDSNVAWIIKNSNKDINLLNRVLRYPIKNNGLIYKWALKNYNHRNLKERKSEIIGIILTNENYSIIEKENNKDVIYWAIYYSQLNIDNKMKLLKESYNNNFKEEFLNVCLRLNISNFDFYKSIF